MGHNVEARGESKEALIPPTKPKNLAEMFSAVGLPPINAACTDFLGPALVEGDGSHDAYLHQLVLTVLAGSGMKGIMKPGLPGHVDYMRDTLQFEEPIVTTDSRWNEPVIKRDFDWSQVGRLWTTFPDSFFPEDKTLTTRHAQELADSKAHLHDHAARFGVPLMHGGAAYSEDGVRQLVQETKLPVRVKRGDSGCGGDWVRLVTNDQELEAALRDLYAGGSHDVPIVVEADAGMHEYYEGEEIVGNYCLTAAVGPEQAGIFAVTSQKYSGEDNTTWLGSERVYPPDEHMDALKTTFTAYAQYLRESCGYMGPSGPDLFVMRNKTTGELTARIFDNNARLPISAYSMFVAHSLGYEHFVNLNVDLPFVVTDFNQIKEAGLAVPPYVWLASKSTEESPSSRFKLFIGGHTDQEVTEALNNLKYTGVEIAK